MISIIIITVIMIIYQDNFHKVKDRREPIQAHYTMRHGAERLPFFKQNTYFFVKKDTHRGVIREANHDDEISTYGCLDVVMFLLSFVEVFPGAIDL